MNEINRELENLISQKKLSNGKVKDLISLHKIIDRISSKPYLSEVEVKKIEAKFGVKPDIITWGDYFQTQIGSNHWEKSDIEFTLICDTIIFDIIAATMIFTNKNTEFMKNIEKATILSRDPSAELSAFEREEANHLGTLLEYYRNMNLKMTNLSSEDFDFFERYSQLNQVAV